MLISFLNAVLQLENNRRILSVVIENPYQFPLTTGGKMSVIDISATDQFGRKFIIEMQVADKIGFIKRAQYYASRDYSMQIDSGEKYPALRPTHFIGILNFNIAEGTHYLSHHATIDLATGEHLLKDVQYFFIELKKFNKEIGDLLTMIDKWTFFIKNATSLAVVPTNIQDDGLKAAYEIADKHNWSKEELKAYDDAAVRGADLEQERLKAEELGEEKGKRLSVIKPYQKGKTAEEISDFLDIPITEVLEIISDYESTKPKQP